MTSIARPSVVKKLLCSIFCSSRARVQVTACHCLLVRLPVPLLTNIRIAKVQHAFVSTVKSYFCKLHLKILRETGNRAASNEFPWVRSQHHCRNWAASTGGAEQRAELRGWRGGTAAGGGCCRSRGHLLLSVGKIGGKAAICADRAHGLGFL